MTFKVRNIGAIRRRVKKLSDGFTSDKTELTKTAKVIQNELRRTLREGEQSNNEKFPPLATATKTNRGKMSANNSTSKYYEKSKSNATFTGELIRKIKTAVNGQLIEIFASGTHKKYRSSKGKPIGKKAASIADIVRGFSDNGVQLLGVTNSAKVKIKKLFMNYLRRRRS